MLSTLRKLGKFWDQAELFLGGLFLSLSVLIIATEITLRRFFQYSMIGSDEIAAFSVVWSVLFTASLAVKNNLHVRIDVIFFFFPPTVGRYIDALGTLFSMGFTAFLAWSGYALVVESLMLGEVTMTMLRLPVWIPQLILPIGGFLLTLRLGQRFLHLLFGHRASSGEEIAIEAHNN